MAIDWNVIKADYLLHHELSLTALAEKYGVEYPSLNSVASREHWAEERANRGAEIQRKALAAAEINQVESWPRSTTFAFNRPRRFWERSALS